MEPANWKQIKAALADAMELASEEREEFVSSLDPEIGAQVRRYLRAVTDARDFMNTPALIDRGLVDQHTDHPVQVDDFRILQPIGSGGMGTVYLAEHAGDGFKQLVAIKLIKRGMDTSAVLKRFLMERRILAELDHPNIARMLDGGSTDDGLPYFVMEYVEGDEIRKYANANNLGLEERLELFRTVCSAVSSAHQRLVIHRDIKPTNILVTKDGEPKLLDFGIAKLISRDWNSDEATLTQFRALTPEYASPEQMDGSTVSTATDVYSLGVVLYELLTGCRPFSFREKDGQAVADSALTTEPPRPSVIAARSAQPNNRTKQRLVDKPLFRPARVTVAAIEPSRLRGDLDNIILKAIRHEPERRYQSVQEFSDDIRRWLDGLPVNATSDSRMYRFGKFFKRHRTSVLASGAAAILLITASAVTGWQYSVARDQQAKAEARFQSIRLVARSLLNETSRELENLPQSAEIRDSVVERAIALLNSLSVDENTDPEFLDEVADAYEQLAQIRNWKFRKTSEAIADYRKALALRERVIREAPENFKAREKLSSTLSGLSEVYDLIGDSEETGRLRSRIVENHRSMLLIQPGNPKIIYSLAAGLEDLAVRIEASSPEQAAAYRSESLTILLDALRYLPSGGLSAQDTELYVSIKMLQGFLLDKAGKADEALAIFQEGLETAKSAYLGDESQLFLFNHTARLSRMIADIHISRNDWAKALENYEFSLAWIRDHRGNPKLSPRTLRSGEAIYTVRIGRALHKLGRKKEALTQIAEGLNLHFDYAAAYANDASILIYSPEILSTASSYFAESGNIEPGRAMWQKFAGKVSVFLERNPNDAQMSGLLAFARESEGDLISGYSSQSNQISTHDRAALTAAVRSYTAALEIHQRLSGKHSADAAARLDHKLALCRSFLPASQAAARTIETKKRVWYTVVCRS
ncbi:MAG TPA: serine/threonine-protein kinase [Pyrinomonadaceae bacterium]|nr:serine/threonine-protein kinase [Pyrinomonadaceae bacterium]